MVTFSIEMGIKRNHHTGVEELQMKICDKNHKHSYNGLATIDQNIPDEYLSRYMGDLINKLSAATVAGYLRETAREEFRMFLLV